jgi:NADH:ubiquinone oxidoreductase subunit F (NADH-binding)
MYYVNKGANEMSEKVIDYDDVKNLLGFLGVKYIVVKSDSSSEIIVVLKNEENFQMQSSYRE